MIKIQEFLAFGIVKFSNSLAKITVSKLVDLNILISLFQKKGNFFGSKGLDLIYFIKIKEILKSNANKPKYGLQKIEMIKRKMNLRIIHEEEEEE